MTPHKSLLSLLGGLLLTALGPTGTRAQTTAVPEFAALARLLQQRQNVHLGTHLPQDSTSRSLVHFQQFRSPSGIVTGTFEEHADGTVYLAYVPPTGPVWYDVTRAEDLAGPRSRTIAAGRGFAKFEELFERNVDQSRWVPPGRAFPEHLGPAPRWYTFALPVSEPCATERSQLAELERLVEEAPRDRLPRLIWEVERPVRKFELERLTVKLQSDSCRPRASATWPALLEPRDSGRQLGQLVPYPAQPLARPGDYCFNDVVTVLDPFKTGPPSWQTILPENTLKGFHRVENGQKKYQPDLPVSAPGNHFISWDELKSLVLWDTARARRILKWNGHPTREDIKDRTVPWLSSDVQGWVTESFVSGSDYARNHYDPPPGYWLGDGVALVGEWLSCGLLEVVHAWCNDWITFITPIPEYRFTLTAEQDPVDEEATGHGNFSEELRGNLETEIEQWLIPGGFRPEPGDWIQMTGRWAVDCAHDDWHGELHPLEAFVTEHAVDGAALASVVVTGDWPGGDLDLDIWPPPRPSASAVLTWRQQRLPVARDLTVTESLQPADNPNHLRLHIASRGPRTPLLTGDWNQVAPDTTRRLAAKYRLEWRELGKRE